MGKKPRTAVSEDDPIPAIRIDEEFHRPARRAAKRKNLGITRLVNQAIREFLEREGLWPPSGPK